MENGTAITLTCRACRLTTSQAYGTRPRTICPHCGNFYPHQDNSQVEKSGRRTPSARRRGTKTPAPSTAQGNRKEKSEKIGRRTPTVNDERRSESRTSRKLNENSNRTQIQPQSVDKDKFPALQEKNENERPNSRLNTITNFFKKIGQSSRTSSPQSSLDSVPTTSMIPQSQLLQSHDIKLNGNGSHLLPPLSLDSSGRLTAESIKKVPSYGNIASELGSSTEGPLVVQLVDENNFVAKSLEELRAEVHEARDTGEWKHLQSYYSYIFDSFQHLNQAFKQLVEFKTTEDCMIDLDHVYGLYTLLTTHPQDVQKAVLKAIINCLLKERRQHTLDDLRAYMILLLNPQFRSIPTYMIFAHLLRQISTLNDNNHHHLVHWFKRIQAGKFKDLVGRLQKFISCRLFPPKPDELPPVSKCSWWIPSATKVLALLNAASNLCQPMLVTYMDFYNDSLDHLDLLTEYYTWQSPNGHSGFSFCQYPFILSILAKRTILQRDSEQQMVLMARRSLVAKVQQRQVPDIGMLFLNLTVRRSNLVSDSLNEIARKQTELKKKLKVTFAGEPGLDMGGLTKEWFLLLLRQVFKPEYGMFTYDSKSRVFWFSSAQCENYQEFNLVGVLMGLAVYNSIVLDIRFPHVCYRKLLSPAVVPYNMPTATVGVAKARIEDLEDVFPDLAHGLKELLNYEGDVEGDFGLTFQITHTEFEAATTHNLKPNGENIPVTNDNRQEYVQLYIEYLINGSIYKQFQAFYHGFHSVCASNALIMLRPEEVELLVCGNPSLDMQELKRVTVYDGYTPSDDTVVYFWEIVLAMSESTQKQLLLFVTGSDRIPVGGMSEMLFKITRVDNITMLPMSHTCFNQLVLPAFRSRRMMKEKLLIAIQNAEGFGLE